MNQDSKNKPAATRKNHFLLPLCITRYDDKIGPKPHPQLNMAVNQALPEANSDSSRASPIIDNTKGNIDLRKKH